MNFADVRKRVKGFCGKITAVQSTAAKEAFGDVFIRKLSYGEINKLGKLAESDEAMAYQICYGLVDEESNIIFDPAKKSDRKLILDLPADSVMELNEEINAFNSPKEAEQRKN